ncbi:polysaccharide pyruvyl transferase family protein [Kribbella kalugense]|uniref:Polysaccharide pyruvyl transferase WcaK-like protein n=1 Tax=Kribbella kalugense TaxID=2512221 RepID=A0A4V3G8M1_9ACTN|nr:polysaccharide pyruvyl transferase family protein [Kribbella kalugense]TDW23484.1 polysaccharide pyruvyl transferase WcaK-like protein [Kribbella kalugense]
MSSDSFTTAAARGPRIGLFGLLGHGNLGNDGSLEAFLAFLAKSYPDAEIDFLCSGPEVVEARYGLRATRMNWNRDEYNTASSLRSVALKGIGKIVDFFWTASWVRRHDVVVVPGMGVLEGGLPLRWWGFPYSLLLLTAAGRVVGTKVALVSVGANSSGRRMTRRVFTLAARLAYYRSFRDQLSKDAMRATGLGIADDPVYPDLAFSLPIPEVRSATPPGEPTTVGVGVMTYRGTEDDRDQGEEVFADYLAKMTRFVDWLVEHGHRVRLLTGDHEDELASATILAAVRAGRPDLDPSWVVDEPPRSLDELMEQMAAVDTIVATRYHNVVCALMLSKPTVSIGYAAKNDVLMADMGLAEFCQYIRTLDVDRLMSQYTALESRRDVVGQAMDERNAVNRRLIDEQYEVLTSQLFPKSAETLEGRS